MGKLKAKGTQGTATRRSFTTLEIQPDFEIVDGQPSTIYAAEGTLKRYYRTYYVTSKQG